MAIAAIVLHSEPASLGELKELVKAGSGVLDCEAVTDNRLAATVELPADKLPAALQALADLPQALDLELVYVNYEEDAEAEDGIPCPPLGKSRKLS